jgi:Arc/MetJ family transcription regulator
MRTTVDIDDDLLLAAKSLARTRGQTLGATVSGLLRTALGRPTYRRERNGVPLLRVREGAGPVTPEQINALRDQDDLR